MVKNTKLFLVLIALTLALSLVSIGYASETGNYLSTEPESTTNAIVNEDNETFNDGEKILGNEIFSNGENNLIEEKVRIKDYVQYDKVNKQIALDMIDRKLQVSEDFNSNYIEVKNPRNRIKAKIQYAKTINNQEGSHIITDEEIEKILNKNVTSDSDDD